MRDLLPARCRLSRTRIGGPSLHSDIELKLAMLDRRLLLQWVLAR
jgi:hypothetical protein